MPANDDLPDTVVLDTCVLLSNPLRWLLLRLGAQQCFRPVWSPVIGDEWRRNAGRAWGLDPADARARWDALQQLFPDASQEGIEPFKAGIARSDPKDWHVIAAGRAALALRPAARVAVLTRNIKDFNRAELRRLGLGLFDPDRFLARCLWRYPALLAALLDEMPQAAAAAGRPVEPLDAVLRRERLFRVNRLLALPDYGMPAAPRRDAAP